MSEKVKGFRERLRPLKIAMNYFFREAPRKEREELRRELREELWEFHLLVRALSSEASRDKVLAEEIERQNK